MFRRARHRRLLRALRIAVLLVFAFGLVTQPVLGALGEVHELMEHTDSGGGHTDHNLPHEPAPTTPADERDAGGPMHVLLHHVHCCGNTVGLTSVGLPLPSYHWPTGHPGDTMARPVASSHAATPFRPPISV